MHRTLEKTESFLKANYPWCSLMPSRNKASAYVHRGMSASVRWEKWHTTGRGMCLAGEVCATLVLLYGPHQGPPFGGVDSRGALGSLIVIDVDNEDLATDLTSRFPAILETAIQKTKKGRHFIFRRSALCEEKKVVDKAGAIHYPPRTPDDPDKSPYKIDIKTVCSTGTGGCLEVAPSPGKTWLRPPWVHPPMDIPDDFLSFLLSYHADHTVSPSTKSLPKKSRPLGPKLEVMEPLTPGTSVRSFNDPDDCDDAASSTSFAYTSTSSLSASCSASCSASDSASVDRRRDDDQDIVEMVEQCLSADRASGYTTWLNVGLCLYNVGGHTDKFLEPWLAFSRKGGDAYICDDACRVKWASFAKSASVDAGGPRLGAGSIYFWAKEDAPETYAQINNRHLCRLLLAAATGIHGKVAAVVVHMYRHRFVCTSINDKSWFEFALHRWRVVQQGFILRRLMKSEVASQFHATADWCMQPSVAAKMSGDDKLQASMANQSDAMPKIETKLDDARFKSHVMTECADDLFNCDFFGKLDKADHLIGFENGVNDLDAGCFRDGRPDDYVSMSTGYDYAMEDDVEVQADIARFIDSIMPTSAMAEYLMRVLAYLLHGCKFMETIWFFTGKSGRNGKGVLCTLLKACLGNYYYEPSSELFTTTIKNFGAANPELANSRGKLAMVSSEPADADGATFKVNKLKNWRGNDTIQARDLYESIVSFRPKFAIILVMNDKPMLDKMDPAISKTLRIIEFPFEFTEHPVPPSHKLIDSGIKGRFERGLKYKRQFMRMLLAVRQDNPAIYKLKAHIPYPAEVAAATEAYMDDNNSSAMDVAAWLEEHYVRTNDPGDRVKSGELLMSYSRDCCNTGAKLSTQAFKKAMESCGLVSQKVAHCMQYTGLVRKRTSSIL